MSAELIFEGRRFIPSREAARMSGYAPDYIGQLCRSGRLDARHIGRNWYISEESLLHHRALNLNTNPANALRLNGNNGNGRPVSDAPSALPVEPFAVGAPDAGKVVSATPTRLIPRAAVLQNSAAHFPSPYPHPLFSFTARAAIAKTATGAVAVSLVFGAYSFVNSSVAHAILGSASRAVSDVGVLIANAVRLLPERAALRAEAVREIAGDFFARAPRSADEFLAELGTRVRVVPTALARASAARAVSFRSFVADIRANPSAFADGVASDAANLARVWRSGAARVAHALRFGADAAASFAHSLAAHGQKFVAAHGAGAAEYFVSPLSRGFAAVVSARDEFLPALQDTARDIQNISTVGFARAARSSAENFITPIRNIARFTYSFVHQGFARARTLVKLSDPAKAVPSPALSDRTTTVSAISSTTPHGRIIAERIVDRVIVERPVPAAPAPIIFAGVSEQTVNEKLSSLQARLAADIASVRTAGVTTAERVISNTTYINNVYQTVAGTNNLDYVANLDLDDPTILRGMMTNTEVSNIFGSFRSLSGGGLTLSGGATLGGDLTVYGNLTPQAITATSSISAPYFVATSTTATSTYAGGIAVQTDKLIVESGSGNVGLGTTSPAARLALSGYANSTNPLLLISTSTPSATSTALIITATGNLGLSTTSPTSRLAIEASTPQAAFLLNQTGTGNLLTLEDNGTQVFVVRDGGTVGIGTTTPAQTLSVQGNLYTSGTGFFGGALTATSTLDVTGLTTLVNASTTRFTVSNDAWFATSGGSVGIGTTSPARLLSVHGNALLSGDLSVAGLTATSSVVVNSAARTSGSTALLSLTGGADTGLTASTEAADVQFNLARTKTHANGTLTLQRDFLINAATHAFTNWGAGLITDLATLGITGAPLVGTNATTTNAHTLLLSASTLNASTTNSYGLTVNANTGATNNYAAAFLGGNTGFGTTSPARLLAVHGQCVTADTRLRRRRRRKKRNSELGTLNLDSDSDPSSKLQAPSSDFVYDEVQIKDIKEGDEIASLDERTGRIVWSKVKALMDMGVKPIFKLTTASGKTIRTTGNHPYLMLTKEMQKKNSNLSAGASLTPSSIAKAKSENKSKLNIAVFIDYANIKAWLRDKGFGIDMKLLYSVLHSAGIDTVRFYYGADTENIGIASFFRKLRVFGYTIITKPIQYFRISLLTLLQQQTNTLWLEKVSASFKKSLKDEAIRMDKEGAMLLAPKANFDVEITTDVLGTITETDHVVLFSGDGDFVYLVQKLKALGKKVTVVSGRKSLSGELMREAYKFVTMELFAETVHGLIFEKGKVNTKGNDRINAKLAPHKAERVLKNCGLSVSSLLGLSSDIVDNARASVQSGTWTKAAELKEGAEIAVAPSFLSPFPPFLRRDCPEGGSKGEIKRGLGSGIAVWEKVTKIEHLPEEQVYDIEVEGTHNFIGNDIVAHNTYLSGNTFIGGDITATSSTITFSGLGTNMLASLNASGNLVATSTPTAAYYLATSSIASIFPYASTTAITATTASTTNLTVSALSTTRIPFLTTAGAFTDDSDLTFTNGNLLTATYASSTSITTTGYVAFATSGGNVGVGTTSPSRTLAVHGNFYTSGSGFFGGALTATSTLDVTGLTTLVNASTTRFTVSNDAWFATSGGSVGIGTTSPARLLSVHGNALLSGDLSVAGLTATSSVTINSAARTSGSTALLSLTGGADTGLTASTEAADVQFNLARTKTHANGTLSLQRDVLINAATHAFTSWGAGLITDLATLGITGAPLVGTNATTTNAHTLLLSASALNASTTNSYGLTVNANTGAGSNYAAAFLGGNTGFGTTSPARLLAVQGQCVTADTRLRRRRKKGKGKKADPDKGEMEDNEYIYDTVEIVRIKEGDEIQSLNQKSGLFVWSKVHKLMDMGEKQLYRLTTLSHRTIRTTENHPYFVRTSEAPRTPRQTLYRFEADLSMKIEDYSVDTVVAVANAERSFTILVPRKMKQTLRDRLRRFPRERAPALYAAAIVAALRRMNTRIHELVVDTDYKGHNDVIARVVSASFPGIELSFARIGKKSPAHRACYGVHTKRAAAIHTATQKELEEKAESALPASFPQHRGGGSESHQALSDTSRVYQGAAFVKHGEWTKVKDIRVGQYIAVAHGNTPAWERVVKIEELPAERVYDVEIEGTHNFIGNDIVAHNTYLSGNTFIGGDLTATSSTITFSGLGTNMLASLNASGNLVATSTPTASHYLATSSIASIFPYASSTALTVSGTGGLYVGTLTGLLQATAGAVTASTSPTLTALSLTSLTPHMLLTLNGSGAIVSSSTPTAAYYLATSSIASFLPYASSTSLTTSQGAWLATSGGSVGIGTTSPYGLFSIEQGTETASLWVGNTGSSTPSLVINGVNGDGRIGIGSSTPSELLSIERNGTLYMALRATTGTGQLAGIKLQRGTTVDDLDDWSIYNSGGSLYFDSVEGTLGTNTRLFINDQNGRVGIGTTTPGALLSVHGNGLFSGTLSTAGLIATSSTITFSGLGTNMLASINNSGNLVATSTPTAAYYLATSSIASIFPYASTTRFTVSNDAWFATSGGSVGIGTTTPARLLSVQGNALLSGDLSVAGLTATSSVAINSAARTSGSTALLSLTGGADTGLTAGTEANDILFDLNRTKTHANGTIALQRDIRINAATHAFTNWGAGLITDLATLGITGAPLVGTNATTTNAHTLLLSGSTLNASTTNSYGLTVNANTGAGQNYAAAFLGGNTGFGTTSPSRLLSVHGQCVTGDTRLRRRRRKKRNSELGTLNLDSDSDPSSKLQAPSSDFVYDEVRIDEIKEGDEIASLDERTGRIVWSKVKALMDMGVKDIFELKTATGKTIRTTGNHPYLMLPSAVAIAKMEELRRGRHLIPAHSISGDGGQVKKGNASNPHVGATGSATNSAIRTPTLDRGVYGRVGIPDTSRTFAFIDASNVYHAVLREGWEIDYKKLYTYLTTRYGVSRTFFFSGTTYSRKRANLYDTLLRAGYELILVLTRLISKGERKADVDSAMTFEMMRRIGEYDAAIVLTGDGDYYDVLSYLLGNKTSVRLVSTTQSSAADLRSLFGSRFIHLNSLRHLLEKNNEAETTNVSASGIVPAYYAKRGYLSSATVDSGNITPFVKGGVWTKVSQMKEGQFIAVRGANNKPVYERIVSITRQFAERVYDVEIEGTHNFVAGHYVNTQTNTALTEEQESIVALRRELGTWNFELGSATIEDYGRLATELRKVAYLARRYGAHAGDIQEYLHISENGDVWTDQSVAKSGKFRTAQYRGGERQREERIRAFSYYVGNINKRGADSSDISVQTFLSRGNGVSESPESLPRIDAANAQTYLESASIVLQVLSSKLHIPEDNLIVFGGIVAHNTYLSGNTFIGGDLTATSSTITFSGLGTNMLASLNASGNLVATSTPTAAYYLATSTTASILRYASTTALTVSGTEGLYVGTLTGPLQAISGAVSASSTLSVFYGGTGANSFTANGVLYGNGGGTLSVTAQGGANTVLTANSGVPSFSSTPTLTSLTLTGLGTNMLLTSNGSGAITASSTPTAAYYLATSSIASSFPYASTTALTVSQSAYFATVSGNVGIGTAGPVAKLDVAVSANSATQVIQVLQNPNTGTSAGAVLEYELATSGGTNKAAGQIGVIKTADWASAANEDSAMRFYTRKDGTLTEQVRIDKDGNVGIGDTSPVAMLTVGDGDLFQVSSIGALTLTGNPNSGNRPRITLTDTAGAGSWDIQPWVVAGDGNIQISRTAGTGNFSIPTGNVGIGTTSPWGLLSVEQGSTGPVFVVSDQGTSTPHLLVAGSGNVGIGTTSPQANLGIVGSLGVSSTHFVLSADGKVGIGKASPSRQLELAAGSANIRITNLTGIDHDIDASQSVGIFDINVDANNEASAPAFRVLISDSEKMRILDAGNVGIGTTSPWGLLSVEQGSTGPVFVVSDTGTSTPHLLVSGSGNVGIGTAGPTSKLHIFSPDAVDSWNQSNVALVTISNLDQNADQSEALLVRGGANSATTQVFEVQDYSGNADFTVWGDGEVTMTGNVGIGTASPGTLLSLGSAVDTDRQVFQANNDGTGSLAIYTDDQASNYNVGNCVTGYVLCVGTRGGSPYKSAYFVGQVIMGVNSAGSSIGNVGIGTTSPAYILDVQSATAAQARVGNNQTTGGTSQVADLLLGFYSTNSGLVQDGARVRAVKEADWTTSANEDSALTFQTRLDGSTSEKVRITSSGNVGIGTTSPQGSLHIDEATTDTALQINRTGGNTGNAIIKLQTNATDDWIVGERNDSTSNFRIYSYGTASDVFSILRTTGNVGIGTTSPWGLLSVEQGSTGPVFVVSDTGTSTPHLLVSGSGNVGIGTAGPGKRLSLANDSELEIGISNVGTLASGLKIWRAGDPSVGLDFGNIWMKDDGEVVASQETLHIHGRNIAFGIAGSDTNDVVINSSGNVGIGTTSPYTKLAVMGEISIGSPGVDDGVINVPGGSLDFLLKLQGTTRMFVSREGNVGIGTTSPSELLHIESTSDADVALRTIANGDQSSVFFQRARASGTIVENGDNFGTMYMYGYDGANFILGAGMEFVSDGTPGINDMPGRIEFHTTADGASTITERMRIDNQGNVGIGTTTPLQKLVVSGDTAPTMRIENTDTTISTAQELGTLDWYSHDADGTPGVKAAISVYSTDTHPDGEMAFLTASGGTLGERMRINNVGNVGIGEGATSPTAQVHIIQTDAADAFRVDDVASDTTPFVIDQSGNVGIGTTGPLGKMEIYQSQSTLATSFTSPHLRLGSDGVNNTGFTGISYAVSLTNNYGWTSGASRGADVDQGGFIWKFHNNSAAGTELMRITTSGNVGIGTTTPNGKLNVYTGAAGSATVPDDSSDDLVIESNAAAGITILGTNAGGQTLAFGIPGDAVAARLVYDGFNNQFTIGTANASDFIQFQVADQSNAMRIDTLGNVGIGTTSPGQVLAVQGSNNSFRLGSALPGEAVWGRADNGTTNLFFGVEGPSASGVFLNSLPQAAQLGTDKAQALQLSTNNVVRVTIDSTGNVGIGTTSPWGLLSVEQGSTGPVFVVSDTGTSTPHLLVSGSGNVGIGTAEPGEKLDVRDGNFILSDADVAHGVTDRAPTTAYAKFSPLSGTTGGLEMFTFSDTDTNPFRLTAVIGATDPTDSLAAIDIWGAKKGAGTDPVAVGALETVLTVQNWGTKLLNILGNGNVGIGTTTPTEELSIFSTGSEARVKISNSINTSSASSTLEFWNNTVSQRSMVGYGNGTANGLWLWNYDTSSVILGTSDRERMRIDLNGNVGIGTTSPLFKLAVESTSEGNMFQLYDTDGNCRQDPDAGGITTTCSSDERLKTNIASASAQLPYLLGLSIREYDVIASGDHRVGVVAQELLSSGYSELVSMGEDGYYGVQEIGSWKIIKALQEIGNVIDLTSATTSAASIRIDAAGNALLVPTTGNVGVGTSTPEYKLHVMGDVAAMSFVNISTRTAKRDITYLGEEDKRSVLEKIRSIGIATYQYNSDPICSPAQMNADRACPSRLGLIAEEAPQEVLSANGKGVDVYKLSTFILAGVQEQQKRIESLELRVTRLETLIGSTTPASADGGTPFVKGDWGGVVEYLAALGAKFAQGLAELKTLVVEALTVGNANRPTAITVYDKNGKAGCLTIEDVETGATKVTAGACGTNTTTPSAGGGHPSSSDEGMGSADTTPPTLTVNGNNPATIAVGAVYADLGATVTDNVNNNLGYKTFVNGAFVTQISLDTSSSTTYTISYAATDGAGNTATTSRTVIVGSGATESLILNPSSLTTEENTTPPQSSPQLMGGGEEEAGGEEAGAEETATTTPTAEAEPTTDNPQLTEETGQTGETVVEPEPEPEPTPEPVPTPSESSPTEATTTPQT